MEEAKWYVVHTYSGYENTVCASIEKAVENRGMHDLIQEVNIPMETVTEITDNGPKTVERKVFPGYVPQASSVRATKPSLSPTRRSPLWAWRSTRSWSPMPWATM